jgi:excisionase family DNA binding protein
MLHWAIQERERDGAYKLGTDAMVRPKLLTVSEVSEWLNVSSGWVRDHATGRRQPALPSIKLGKSLRFDETRVAEWLRELQERKAA